jgi:hypothetical protein
MLTIRMKATAALFGLCMAGVPGSAPAQEADEVILHAPERGGIGLELYQQKGPAAALEAPLVLDPRSSIFVTDQKSVEQISFAEVMDQLAGQSPDPFMTKLVLFRRWWDSAARAPGVLAVGPHCDDETFPQAGLSQKNGFPYRCPREEQSEADSDPFSDPAGPGGYGAIALSNRFDLADPAGKDCGEYRIVFARNSGKTNPLNRNLIIFEARVPNPSPNKGIAGCRPIQDFWVSLSQSMTPEERGRKLRDFYMTGLPAARVGPVVHIDTYSMRRGQIRTNQFLDQAGKFIWILREFKIRPAGGSIYIAPVTVKSNPGNSLFDANSPDPRAPFFPNEVTSQLQKLAGGSSGVGDVNAIAFNVNQNRFNALESDEGHDTLGDVLKAFTTNGPGQLGTKIQQAITAQASPLTVDNVVRRIRTQTCAGCHQYSNGDNGIGGGATWPSSLGFTHESERDSDVEAGPNGPRFKISPALAGFLQFRAQVIAKFLATS